MMTQPDWWACGVALVLALVAVALSGAVACLVLRSSILRWREIAKVRQTEIAFEALALAYETQFLCDTIRHAFAEEPSRTDVKSHVRAEHRRAAHYSAILKRLDLHNSYFARLWRLQPRYIAEFGADRAAFFRKPQEALSAILVNSDEAMRDAAKGEPYQVLDYWRNAGAGNGPSSEEMVKITALLREFVDRIQQDCTPIVTAKSQRAASESESRRRTAWRRPEFLSPLFNQFRLGNFALRQNRTFRRIRRRFMNNYQIGLWIMFAVFAAGFIRLLVR